MRKYKFAEEREVEYIKVTKENIGGKHPLDDLKNDEITKKREK